MREGVSQGGGVSVATPTTPSLIVIGEMDHMAHAQGRENELRLLQKANESVVESLQEEVAGLQVRRFGCSRREEVAGLLRL